MRILENKNVLVGVTGSIAAYKAADLVSMLKKEGCNIKVLMTESSQEFITKTTLEALTGNKVSIDSKKTETNYEHLDLSKWADIVVIAPCTANVMNKISNGLGDDLLSTTCLAFNKELFIVPAMNPEMWNNDITQGNLKKLEHTKIKIIGPEYGKHACGDFGYGKMTSPDQILEKIKDLNSGKILSGLKILVTAGPTREPIDPVRFISNYSSGKMGYSIAYIAHQLGADVELISGPTFLDDIKKIGTHYVETAEQMAEKVFENITNKNIFISTAAIADYRPAHYSSSKHKKSDESLKIELERGVDIISEVSKNYKKVFTVGFAAETEDLIMNAKNKLKKKNLDMIVANIANHKNNIGFESDYNKVTVITPDFIEDVDSGRKLDVAHEILRKIHRYYFQAITKNKKYAKKS